MSFKVFISICVVFLTILEVVWSAPAPPSTNRKTVITWQNIEEFFADGWEDGWIDRSPGVGYAKPSIINSTLYPLDEGVTGNGVWTGEFNFNGSFSYGFYFNKSLSDFNHFGNITGANLTLKYYIGGHWRAGIWFFPCEGGEENTCSVGEDSAIKWHTVTFPVNLTEAEMDGQLEIIGVGYHPDAVILIDEVALSLQTEGSSFCNESSEFRAIDCHNYYSCVDYSYKRFFTCAGKDGLAFNPKLGTCDRKELVEGCTPPTWDNSDCDERIALQRGFRNWHSKINGQFKGKMY